MFYKTHILFVQVVNWEETFLTLKTVFYNEKKQFVILFPNLYHFGFSKFTVNTCKEQKNVLLLYLMLSNYV